jgi:hypothetical protein
MRLLLIAYEFPPSPSPQSLRWTYLVRELAALGHEIHVLAPDLGGETHGLPQLPDAVHVHRCFAGPFRGLMAWRRKRRHAVQQGPPAQAESTPAGAPVMLRPPRNWKQRISECVQAILERVLFPDLRGEWKPCATLALHRLLRELQPDLVISSHEPATTLELGLMARAQGFRWVADLGDPVLAGYTPPHWRARAGRLEQSVFRHVDLLIVTTPATATLLQQRHACGDAHASPLIQIVTQGFDARASRPPAPSTTNMFDRHRLELLYTGSLYSFRRIDALLGAVASDPALRLSIAAVTVPEHVLAAARALPAQIRLLGFAPHSAILELQREADVLVNLANADMTQVPGKIFEYLGAQRPILHLGSGNDPAGALVEGLRRGWVCENEAEALVGRLHALVRAKAESRLEHGLQLELAPVLAYSWREIAADLDRGLHALTSADS